MLSPHRILILLVVTAGAIAPAFGQGGYEYSAEAETLFRSGLAEFTAGRYAASASAFQTIVATMPTSHRITAAHIMWGKALFEEGQNLEASRVLRTFLVTYPGSTYIADAHLTLGMVYARVGRRNEALGEFRLALRTVPAPASVPLFASIVDCLDSTIDSSMTPLTVRRMLGDALSADERAYLWVRIGEKELAQENILGATIALDTLARHYPRNPFASRIGAIRGHLTGSMDVKIAALLPLVRTGAPSAAKEVAGDLYDGIVYALERYTSDTTAQIKVSLLTRDTERSTDIAGRSVRELAADRGVIAIIGPIFSNTTGAAAAVAQTEGVPLVSPTANSNGIAAAGQYVFQANPDYTTRGRAMARYAVLLKGYRVLATLSPKDTYGKFLVESFIREAEALGARVVSQEWYQKGATDLKEQLTGIRRASMMEGAEPMISFSKVKTAEVMKFLDLGVPKKRIDSLLSAGGMIKATELLGPNARNLLDSLSLSPVFDMTRLDSLEYPATGVQALYIPISASAEVGVISAQKVYHNIQAELLGSGEWNDLSELDEHKRYCSGVVFDSDTYVDTESDSYRQFVSGFTARFKRPPSQNALFGYDTADLVLNQIRNGAASRQAMARALSQVRDFRGLHSRIGFGIDRVNVWLSIMQYDGKAIRKIDEIGMD